MMPEKAKEEVKTLVAQGVDVELIEANGQCYALVRKIKVNSPPWSAAEFDILIAVPAAYDAGALDGFYIALPYKFNDGEHAKVNGGTIDASGRQWRQVSWHYLDGKAWRRGLDSLETHIVHCRGFFLERGVKG
jgi:hypothetical protein